MGINKDSLMHHLKMYKVKNSNKVADLLISEEVKGVVHPFTYSVTGWKDDGTGFMEAFVTVGDRVYEALKDSKTGVVVRCVPYNNPADFVEGFRLARTMSAEA